ncbi:hypothetical protein [Pedobacter faecalis]|uniref:hypothetical protein n=1 Tax=Pedobacter faecalis TaxID=3041495 RepID=UPI00254F14F2|nr:hypothetical protein [Pedobacter sp. ELA7]
MIRIYSLILACLLVSQSLVASTKDPVKPNVVNIVNFIRLLEPRDAKITQDVLYKTVVEQVKMMKAYKLGGTFLLQYDALMDNRYQQLLKSLPRDSFEIGGWWELPQPLVEKAGLKWRGRYPWDWHANVGFSTGYTPVEREKLIDVYMKDFKAVFGYYPKSVGSWFIDAHSLNYMYNKYKIVASSNCKDQYGTDGYTLWGGYWNQAYYPSKINAYMPAQTENNQTPVPIFRMLGSDPIRQYDTGISTTWQGVITLEPVYPEAGGSEQWVKWFLKQFVESKSMEFNYTQAGQENSFTWDAMKKGFEIQLPLIAKLRDQGKVKVETMEQSGLWFRKNYKVTPATAFTVSEDIGGGNHRTAWFNSRFYRTNLIWENNSLRIRDIHLFDEDFPSQYTTGVTTTNECAFYTLPVVDGYLWSNKAELAGIRFIAKSGDSEVLLKGADPVFSDEEKGKLKISWPLTSHKGTIELVMDERNFHVSYHGSDKLEWLLELKVAEGMKLPFTEVTPDKVNASFENMRYSLISSKGKFEKGSEESIFRIVPQKQQISLVMTNGR